MPERNPRCWFYTAVDMYWETIGNTFAGSAQRALLDGKGVDLSLPVTSGSVKQPPSSSYALGTAVKIFESVPLRPPRTHTMRFPETWSA